MNDKPALVAEDAVVERVRRRLRERPTIFAAEPGFTIDGAIHPLDCDCAACVALQEHYAGLAADIPQGGEGNE